MVKRELGVKEGSKSLAQKLISLYLNNYLASLFAGAFVKHDFRPLKPDVSLATKEQVQKAAELLSKAKKPVILVGSQATLPPIPAEKLKQALEVFSFINNSNKNKF